MAPENTVEIQERLVRNLERIEQRLEKMHGQLYSVDPKEPGLFLRVRDNEKRIEVLLNRQAAALGVLKWLGGGGLIGVFGTIVLLWKILERIATTPGI